MRRVLIVAKSPIPACFSGTFLSAAPDQSTQESVDRISYTALEEARRFFPVARLMSVREVIELPEQDQRLDEYDLIVPVGGDGTFLTVAHCVESARPLLLGVNSNPRVSRGFLTPLKFFAESFQELLRRVFEAVVEGRYQALRRTRFQFLRQSHPQKRLLGLNDFFLGPLAISKSVFYDFSTRLSPVRPVRSTGCLLYTGTGATGWARSLHYVGAVKLAFIAQRVGVALSPEQVRAIQADIEAQYMFHPAANVMGFAHREMIPTQKDGPTEGYSDEFFLRNRSLDGGSIAIDGWLTQIAAGEEVAVALAPAEHDLSCLTLDLKQIFAPA